MIAMNERMPSARLFASSSSFEKKAKRKSLFINTVIMLNNGPFFDDVDFDMCYRSRCPE